MLAISGGSLTTQDEVAILPFTNLEANFTNGARIIGGNGVLVDAQAGSGFAPLFEINADDSTMIGDAQAPSPTAAIVNMTLTNRASWTGAALNVANVPVDPTSIWTMTANSLVTQDVTNAGLIDVVPPVGGVFKTLTTQNYLGQGGTLGLNTFLGTDGWPSDKLVINGGAASGDSLLRITNAGGPGLLTRSNGILVVEAIDGGVTAPGAFALSDVVAAGPFEYRLFR